MDLQQELERIRGIDLTTIDGINTISALTIISEIGTDMSGFEDKQVVSPGLTTDRDSKRRFP